MGGETETNISGWTVDTLRYSILAELEHVQVQINGLSIKLDERYETQTKAVDTAFVAQATAMRTALEAAEKAVATALLSAEKAVTKAEVAADKRFESTNEFRGQLADMVATLMNRAEADAKISAIREKQDADTGRLSERINDLASRIDTSEGQATGAQEVVTTRRLDTGLAVSICVGFVAFAGVALGLILK